LPSGMNATSFLVQLRPRSFRRWRALPVFGAHLDRFVRWLHDQGYTAGSIRNYLKALPRVVRWLRRKGVTSLAELTQQHLQAAYNYYRPRNTDLSGMVRLLCRFFQERKTFPKGERPALCPVEVELDRFAEYLRETRGLATATILGHTRRLRAFLHFLKYDQDPSCLRRLELGRIETFLQRSARTNSRFSMQHVVASVRAFLQRQYAQGIVSRTLHLQIDTPRVYRLERLPRALPWTQVQALLGSINRSERFGLRDFTLLYLAAAYGLRSGELVRLTLDDIDWRGRTLRVSQTKTKNAIRLPLTDEAASFLIDYLRRARPESSHRQLFLRMRAPDGALKPTAVHDVLEHRIGLSGLKLPQLGTHVLRHSLAAHLLRQGVGIKTIGDALGHRDIESTSIYLRLGVDDLREVALPAPPSIVTSPCQPLVPARTLPRVRVYRPNRHLPKRFQSSLAASLQRFLELKRTLGRHYAVEAAILSHWDDFLHRQYPQARKVRAAMVYDWAKELSHLSPRVRRNWQRVLRNFLLFHARDHAGTFIPDILTFPKPTPVQPPRLISATEMALIIQCAHQLPPSSTNPLRAETIALGLMLLFCCGLRRGELLRLKLGDIDRNQRLIRIAFTKFHKSRLVPLDPTVADELEYYLQQRHRMKLPMTPDSFLLWSGRRSPEVYAGTSLLTVWRRLCLSVKVLDARGRSPRLHDLRHSFALNALQRWYAEGADVQTKLHSLATYLGHVNPVSTHYYLQLTPELRQSASQRFHQRFAPLFTVGGVV
jgi:integrase/recombinase XerD